MLLGVRAAAVGEPVGREGVRDGGYDAQLDEGGGDVRPPDRAVTGDPGHLLPGDVDAEVLELADHGPGARGAVVADEFPLPGQLGLLGVEEVREHVHADPVEPAGQFGPGHQRQSGGQGREGLAVSAHGVVVGQRDHVQPGAGGAQHQLGGGVRTVGGRGVGVQVDAHSLAPWVVRTGDTPG